MDLDYNVESSLASVLSNFSSSPVSSSTAPEVVFSHPSTTSSSVLPFSTSSPVVVETPSTGMSSVVTTSTVQPSDLLTAGQQRLVDGLEKAAKAFNEAAKPPPSVIVINQLPPAPPSPSWHQDPDLPAVGAAVGFLVIVLLVAGGLWLRKFRPANWELVKSGGRRLITWVALPMSWLCSRAADLLRHLHTAAEGQHVASANSVQVSKTEFL